MDCERRRERQPVTLVVGFLTSTGDPKKFGFARDSLIQTSSGLLLNDSGTPCEGMHPMDAFLARQPILDRNLAVYGYELLFRNGAENYFRPVDGDLATTSLISDALHLHSVEKVTDGRKCFINFTRNALLTEMYAVLPKSQTVVEILESVELDDELLEACRKVRRAGYQLALDDYILEPRFEPLLPLIDLLKVEFPALNEQQHAAIVESAAKYGFELLAEKVETPEQYEMAKQLGYHYFQGYFFCRPQLLKARRLRISHAHFLQLLQLVGQPEFDVDKIEEQIRNDVSLSYKLLRYLNSPMFGRKSPVQSVRHAVTTLGQRPLQQWVSLITINELSGDKPAELMNTCLVRAKFGELVGERLADRSLQFEGFMAGMFSLLDAMLDQPMEDLTTELSLSPSVRAALLGLESPLLPMMGLATGFEQGNWSQISQQARQLGLNEADAFDIYRQSLEWAAEVHQAAVGAE